jgi:hypothetical protein
VPETEPPSEDQMRTGPGEQGLIREDSGCGKPLLVIFIPGAVGSLAGTWVFGRLSSDPIFWMVCAVSFATSVGAFFLLASRRLRRWRSALFGVALGFLAFTWMLVALRGFAWLILVAVLIIVPEWAYIARRQEKQE